MSDRMVGGGVPAKFVGILLGDERAIREDSAVVVSADIAEMLGRPAKRFEDFADEAAALYR